MSRMAPVEVGAKTSIMCATSDEVLPHRGAYYDSGNLSAASPMATTELSAELWARSDAWVAA